MTLLYQLDDDNNVVPAEGPVTWAQWFEAATVSGRRFVERTELTDGTVVSTVFLGTNYNFGSFGPPITFETMVFRGGNFVDTMFQQRYATWLAAQAGHDQTVAEFQSQLNTWNQIVSELEAS